MKKSLFLLVFCIATSITYGQSVSVYRKNAIKINIVPPLVSATSEISYERSLQSNLSIVAGIGGNYRKIELTISQYFKRKNWHFRWEKRKSN